MLSPQETTERRVVQDKNKQKKRTNIKAEVNKTENQKDGEKQ